MYSNENFFAGIRCRFPDGLAACGEGLAGDRAQLIIHRVAEVGRCVCRGVRRICTLDRAVLANLSGCAVDCTGVVRLNRRGVGEFAGAGAVRAGNLGIVLYKVGEVTRMVWLPLSVCV